MFKTNFENYLSLVLDGKKQSYLKISLNVDVIIYNISTEILFLLSFFYSFAINL